jgi:hypothetical protein
MHLQVSKAAECISKRLIKLSFIACLAISREERIVTGCESGSRDGEVLFLGMNDLILSALICR